LIGHERKLRISKKRSEIEFLEFCVAVGQAAKVRQQSAVDTYFRLVATGCRQRRWLVFKVKTTHLLVSESRELWRNHKKRLKKVLAPEERTCTMPMDWLVIGDWKKCKYSFDIPERIFKL
jgi:hypothetical protein